MWFYASQRWWGTKQYRFTVDDPAAFTKPLTVVSPMQRLTDKIYEYACHEGNVVEVREFRPEEKTTVATANRADGATPSYFTIHHSAVEVQRADGGNSETVGEGAAPRSSGGLPRAELSRNSR